MADFVNLVMEEMLPELKELHKKKILKEPELKMILNKRRAHEYRLQSKNSEILDYYRYLHYEITLYKLIQTRIKLKQKKFPKKAKYYGLNRVIRLFERNVKRYAQDVQIWRDYLNFCEQTKLSQTLSTTFARALQHHPLEESFWIRAAFWEYKSNHNISAARSLLQRAMRSIINSRNILLQYCKLELDYRKKILQRFELLGVQAHNVLENTNVKRRIKLRKEKESENNKNEDDENDDTEFEEEENSGDDTVEEDRNTGTENFSNEFLEGAIPLFIFKSASSKYKEDWEYQIEFLKLFKQYPNSEQIEEKAINMIKSSFPENPFCQALLSTLPLSSLSHPLDDSEDSFTAVRTCEDSFYSFMNQTEDASISTSPLPSSSSSSSSPVPIFLRFSDFYLKLLSFCIYPNQKKMKDYLQERLLELYTSSWEKRITSPEIARDWCEILLSKYEWESALKIAEQFATSFAESANVWLFYIHLCIKTTLLFTPHVLRDEKEKKKFEKKIFEIYERSIDRVRKEEIVPIYKSFLDFAIKSNFPSHKLINVIRSAINSVFTLNDEKNDLLLYALNSSFIVFGIDFVRSLSNLMFEFPPISKQIYYKIIEMESSQLQIDAAKIRSIFEKLLSLPPQQLDDTDLWMRYILFEKSQNNFDKVTNLFWKAEKLLTPKNKHLFSEKYHSIQ